MMFNATFSNISVISWWSVLLVEDIGYYFYDSNIFISFVRSDLEIFLFECVLRISLIVHFIISYIFVFNSSFNNRNRMVVGFTLKYDLIEIQQRHVLHTSKIKNYKPLASRNMNYNHYFLIL
jgi:hypothetical protein